VGPPRGHKPCHQTCSSMGSSLQGSTGPGRSLLQCSLPMGSQFPSGMPLLQRGVPSTGCRWRSAPPWTSMDCRAQPASPWSAPGAAGEFLLQCLEHLLPSPSSLTLVSAELFLSHSLTSLPQLLLHCRFFPFLTTLSQRCYHRY